MKYTILVLFLLSSLYFTSCTSDEETIQKTVTNFFIAAADSTSEYKTAELYPIFDSLHVDLKSDVLEFDKHINNNHDTLSIACQNSYTDKLGVFRQDSIKFYLTKNKGTQEMSIIESEGLVKASDEIQEFAEEIGFSDLQKNRDSKLSILKSQLKDYYDYCNLEAFVFIYTSGVTITKWDWETDYSGEPNGQAWIKNNTDFTIRDIGYTVEYSDSRHHLINEDTGIACNKLNPGEKYRFTFYTSHVKNPAHARLLLEFNASTIRKVIKTKGHTRADFEDYCKRKAILEQEES